MLDNYTYIRKAYEILHERFLKSDLKIIIGLDNYLDYQNNYVGHSNWLLERFLQHCHQRLSSSIIILMVYNQLTIILMAYNKNIFRSVSS